MRSELRRLALAASLGLAAGLVVVACSGGEPTPTPPATPPPIPTATPTPSPVREWRLESIVVDGSTVTVALRVFAGVDVRVRLDGRPPDEITGLPPTLNYIFRDVAPGDYTARVSDVVGFVETAGVVVREIVDAESEGV